MKQINTDGGKRPRGRPKKEGEIKQSSVRIRPGLLAQLRLASEVSGESIARELEQRLERSFDDAMLRDATRALLDRLGAEIVQIEAGRGQEWDKNLVTWAMVRELLANGPILATLPHPDPQAVQVLSQRHAELRRCEEERDTITRMLAIAGVNSTGPEVAMFGAAIFGYQSPPDRDEARGIIEERSDIPADMRQGLLEQVDRLEELDRLIDEANDWLKNKIAPYVQAADDARRTMRETYGYPSLPEAITAPLSMVERPATPRRGMFGGGR